MTSHFPKSCCFQGFRHEGSPAGSYVLIDDFEVYIKYPEDKSTASGILLITDVLGHRANNPQLIADQLADNGYLVLIPDLFYGDPIPLNHDPDFDIGKWMQGSFNEKKISHQPPTVDPIIERCLTEMRSKYGCKKIGGIGYCFGGKYVIRFLKGHPGGLDVGYTAHPSNVQVEELRQIKGPLAISAAEDDYLFPTEKRHESEQILQDSKVHYQLNLYSGVQHGFAARCDLSDPRQKYAKESAFLQALEWFEGHGLKDHGTNGA